MRVLWAVVWLGLALLVAPVADAQRALQATRVQTRDLPEPLLTLRPQPALRHLAEEVAAVLELRTGQRVEVGDPPPPGLLEAVPAGHVAMAQQQHAVLLVLGAAGGRSFDATVQVGTRDVASDVRAVALAAEALRDAASDTSGDSNDVAPALRPYSPDTREAREAQDERAERAALVAEARIVQQRPEPPERDADPLALNTPSLEPPDRVEPMVWFRLYSGASTASQSPMTGAGTGLGICARRECLFLSGELPFNTGGTQRLDVRYRYPTFVSGFYSRPFTFGRFTPGASLGFLTRLGHFEADMGMKDTGLDTDLGARATLELGFELARGFDLMSEAGLDLTLDRQRMASAEDHLKNRGDRWSPWLQAVFRYRP